MSFLKNLIDDELSTRTESFVFWELRTFLVIDGFTSKIRTKKNTNERIIAKSRSILAGCLTL